MSGEMGTVKRLRTHIKVARPLQRRINRMRRKKDSKRLRTEKLRMWSRF